MLMCGGKGFISGNTLLLFLFLLLFLLLLFWVVGSRANIYILGTLHPLCLIAGSVGPNPFSFLFWHDSVGTLLWHSPGKVHSAFVSRAIEIQ